VAQRFFVIPVQSSESAEADLNAFLASHKVLTIDRRWVDLGANSFWAICIDYIAAGGKSADRDKNLTRSRIDYKEVLTAEEFGVFSQLRSIRKDIAQLEAIPVYTVFTNEQLAQIIQCRCRTKADLTQIEGIGEARSDKYAARILPLLKTLPEKPDASGGESD
jgi:superfamily II DNA helicase RecQ